MRKIFFCVSLALTGLMSSCVDKFEEVDAESKPEWLGSSIYTELKDPGSSTGLQGTFNTYLRLIDDLGEAETLSRTGSKTVFPANDEAFERFFNDNIWKVSRYEDLSIGQKKLLLYSSMLDNPLLLQLLPNVSNGTSEPMIGQALRHATNVSVIDTVQFIKGSGSSTICPEEMPANNPYWQSFYANGVDLVSDATRPMMIHLTREYMINNNITLNGSGSDFEILTGTQYPKDGKKAYIFNDEVVVSDVTCLNGYIHQMKDVIVPPGNMAQVLRRKENTSYFSRILDYFAVPIAVPKTSDNYNEWARQQTPRLDDKTIYAWRYLSSRSFDSEAGTSGEVAALTRVNGNNISNYLNFDPGWNQYYPKPAAASTSIDYPIMDMGAFFVPSNQAVVDYFVQKSPMEKGPGAYLFDIYGNYKGAENTEAHLIENLDSLHNKNPQVLTAFVNNLMKASFTASVPSKFETVLNDASENMGLTVDAIEKDGSKYDVTFANNGVVYVMNTLYAPDEYNAVLAPASVYPDMRVMNWAVQDRTPVSGNPNAWSLGVDFRYYLLSMSSNYAFFIPDDEAFDCYYLDPTSLGHRVGGTVNGALQPDVLHFYYDTEKKTEPKLLCDRIHIDMDGNIQGSPQSVEIGSVKTQLVDILNYHTIVLPSTKIGDKLVAIGYNGNQYYKTKHGGEIRVDGHQLNGKVESGTQIDKRFASLLPPAEIETIYEEKNGNAYRINHVIQPTTTSVYGALDTIAHPQFSKFVELCMDLSDANLLDWAGISMVRKDKNNKVDENYPNEQDAYTIFTPDYRLGASRTKDACIDMNVKFFNTYNYTLFAPDNTAMETAYTTMGLPRWSDVEALYKKWENKEGTTVSDEEKDDMETAHDMIDVIRDFIRYHFVMGSVYVDNVLDINSSRCKTMTSDELGLAKEVNISGGGNSMMVRDVAGNTVTIGTSDTSKMVNRMARDYWFNSARTTASSIVTSSFCVIHQISSPLCGNSNGKYY